MAIRVQERASPRQKLMTINGNSFSNHNMNYHVMTMNWWQFVLKKEHHRDKN